MPTEGALAPDLGARPRVEPLREIPGLRKRERTWKDEVRERVRDRHRTRDEDPELPLFRGIDDTPLHDVGARDERNPAAEPPAREAELAFDSTEDDLPLRPAEVMATRAATLRTVPVAPSDEETAEDPMEDWSLGATSDAGASRPVERPAFAGERVQAALLDVTLLLGLCAVVVYFASRTARVSVVGLLPAWPYLLGYLAFLSLTYAGYFTGATGQTPGKMALGLRVVDASGGPPGYLRAFSRAFLGSLGVLLAGAGIVPLFLDPARRGLHDRLLKARVIKG